MKQETSYYCPLGKLNRKKSHIYEGLRKQIKKRTDALSSHPCGLWLWDENLLQPSSTDRPCEAIFPSWSLLDRLLFITERRGVVGLRTVAYSHLRYHEDVKRVINSWSCTSFPPLLSSPLLFIHKVKPTTDHPTWFSYLQSKTMPPFWRNPNDCPSLIAPLLLLVCFSNNKTSVVPATFWIINWIKQRRKDKTTF